jgi:O-acetylhomoserine (thiol)-lyase
MFSQPDPAHGNVIWTEVGRPLTSALGQSPFILRARMTVLRDVGACMSPFNAWLFLLGLETLPLRMRAHCNNAQAVAEMLRGHPRVESVTYPGVTTGEERARADTYLKGGYGGLVKFEVAGGVDAGRAFIEALELFYTVPNIGDARSLATHPASTTHAQLPPKDQIAAGVTPGGVRLSVGIEHIEDILADIQRALDAI